MNEPTPNAKTEKKPSMQKLLHHLVQLQDLVVAREQHATSMPGAQLTKLDEAIEGMLAALPPEPATVFQRLRQRSSLVIVPMTGNVCSACGISIPVSLTHAVRAGDKLHHCPSCARLLYHRETAARGVSQQRKRSDAPKLGIERFSGPALLIPDLASNTRDDVIHEICNKLEEQGFVENAQTLFDEAIKREAIITTAVEHGLAFPHVRGVEGGGLIMALGIHRKGVRFDGDARNLTRIVFFMLIPTAASAFYLKLLSGLTQTFEKESSREKLLAADTPAKMWKVLAKITKTTIP